MATKKLRIPRVSIIAEKGWFEIRVEAPLKLIFTIISIIATIYGYPMIVEIFMELLKAK